MRRAVLLGLAASAALALPLAACGGGAEAPAKNPSSESQPATTAPPPPSYPEQHNPLPYGSSGAPSTPSPGAAPPMIEIEGFGRQIELAGSDCATACRALASMERATGRLCAMPDEAARCDDARGRVRTSRTRVKKVCGVCPGGPSTDEGAPIPSTP